MYSSSKQSNCKKRVVCGSRTPSTEGSKQKCWHQSQSTRRGLENVMICNSSANVSCELYLLRSCRRDCIVTDRSLVQVRPGSKLLSSALISVRLLTAAFLFQCEQAGLLRATKELYYDRIRSCVAVIRHMKHDQRASHGAFEDLPFFLGQAMT